MLVEGDNDLDVRVANFTKCNNLFLCWKILSPSVQKDLLEFRFIFAPRNEDKKQCLDQVRLFDHN